MSGSVGDVHASVLEHLATYFDACDRGDPEAVADCLGEAVVDIRGRVAQGRDAIVAMYTVPDVAPTADGRRRMKHHVTNLRITVLADRFVADAYHLRLVEQADGAVRALSGRVRQDAARNAGRVDRAAPRGVDRPGMVT